MSRQLTAPYGHGQPRRAGRAMRVRTRRQGAVCLARSRLRRPSGAEQSPAEQCVSFFCCRSSSFTVGVLLERQLHGRPDSHTAQTQPRQEQDLRPAFAFARASLCRRAAAAHVRQGAVSWRDQGALLRLVQASRLRGSQHKNLAARSRPKHKRVAVPLAPGRSPPADADGPVAVRAVVQPGSCAGAKLVVERDGAAGGVVRDVRAHDLALGETRAEPSAAASSKSASNTQKYDVDIALGCGDVEAVLITAQAGNLGRQREVRAPGRSFGSGSGSVGGG